MALVSRHTLTLHEVRVIDSDTLEAWCEVGHGVRLLWRIRLIAIEGGELDTREGQANAQKLAALVEAHHSQACWFVGPPARLDKYGRHVGDIATHSCPSYSRHLLTSGTYWRRDRTGAEWRD